MKQDFNQSYFCEAFKAALPACGLPEEYSLGERKPLVVRLYLFSMESQRWWESGCVDRPGHGLELAGSCVSPAGL